MDVLNESAPADAAVTCPENSSQEIAPSSDQDTTRSELEQDEDSAQSSNKENASTASMDESVTKECVSEVNRPVESAPRKSPENKDSDKIVTEEITENQETQVSEPVTVSSEQLPEESVNKSLDGVSEASTEIAESAAVDEDAMEVSEANTSAVESDASTKIPEVENTTMENEETMEDAPILLVESEETGLKDTDKMDVDGTVENISSPKAAEPEAITKDDDLQTKDSSVQDSATKEADTVTETAEKELEPSVEDVADESGVPMNDNLSDADDQEMQQENPVFVHVSSKGDGESESDKNSNADLQNETGDESLEATSLVEEDPIGISQEPEKDIMDLSEDGSEKEPTIKVVNFSEAITSDKNLIDEELVASKGADEELCIIPDTEREITQEEKDAARAAAAKAASADVPRLTVLDHGQTESTTSDSDKPTEKSADITNKDSTTDTDGVVIISDTAETAEVATKKTPSVKFTHIPKSTQTEDTCSECNSVSYFYTKSVNYYILY